ncbi:helix-turn-helix domain-containing protein [Bacillus sonorensis]|uniref:helix-turn-helix domain-containing protein n=1 Tax=Bacillus sonorensis TaxID=119858 RepID=UPI00227ECDB2|nr:helix-turn-helix transcriptional regulator [Bacillus sonorensis]MCY8269633.1 helix-turn-helix domain-containing protein [Bacillus sonorensis]MCY8607253.1 helix-turn-helix domain-containing protein [Bacillus sonorensis]
MTFGDRIKHLRKEKGLSQQELADRLSLNRSTYARYELESTQADYDTLKKLANFFGVSIDFLLTGKEHEGSSDAMWKELLNPKTQVLFKDLKDAPEEKIDELIQFWEFIKNRDKTK